MGVSEATVQRRESGNIKTVRYERIVILAEVLDIGVACLMGWADKESPPAAHDNIIPITTKRVPILGDIAAGVPIMAEQECESYVECGAEVNASFALRVCGDSMINARTYDGGLVFIREQPTVEQGEIAAVIIEDMATLKRFYQKGNIITLIAENPNYAPIIIQLGIVPDVRIPDKAIAAHFDIQ